MRDYLRQHCAFHPLAIGVIAGLVRNYLPDRGNFDAWAADPGHGGKLSLANLDLIGKRNHILQAAMDNLPDMSRQILSMLSVLPKAVDYEILSALNPQRLSQREEARSRTQLIREEPVPLIPECAKAWRSPQADPALTAAVLDLEQRGLLQHDHHVKRYDLHPVIRRITREEICQTDLDQYGRQVVDYFSRKEHSPYMQAETIEDVETGLLIVEVLLQIDQPIEAMEVYRGDLAHALAFNLEAGAEILSVLQPLFTPDWTASSRDLSDDDFSYAVNNVAMAFEMLGQLDRSLAPRASEEKSSSWCVTGPALSTVRVT
jgi:hypothetical protein